MVARLERILLLLATIAIVVVAACGSLTPVASVIDPLRGQVFSLLAPATPIPTQTYIVQPGDTPKGVALLFGTTVEILIDLNANTHPEMGLTPMKFNADWRILVPAQTTNIVASGGSNSQVIQSSVTVVVAMTPRAQAQDVNGGSFDYDGALEIIRLTNAERAKVGLEPLTIDETLMEIARKRATEIVSDWGHQGLDDDCVECGENIIKGGEVSGEFQWWMNSEGHRGGILWPEYSQIGAGRYVVSGKAYAVQLFK